MAQLILLKHRKTSLDILHITLSLHQEDCVSCVNAPIQTRIENENTNLYICKSDVWNGVKIAPIVYDQIFFLPQFSSLLKCFLLRAFRAPGRLCETVKRAAIHHQIATQQLAFPELHWKETLSAHQEGCVCETERVLRVLPYFISSLWAKAAILKWPHINIRATPMRQIQI